jgi:uncharacterized protein
MVQKPDWIFDRDSEWAALTAFAADPRAVPTLGVVSGRRRQGKTYLLAALARALGGFYFAADEATEAEALRRFGTALAEFSGVPAQFGDWDGALTFLFAQASAGPVPLIIDEFPLLMRASPELPSLLQRHIDQHWSASDGPPARLLLCGSAMSIMGGLLAGQAPLRGRAGLELVVRPLAYRPAARFWGITDAQLAVRVYAVVGGTPAYRRQFVSDDAPDGPADFDGWVCRTLLNPQLPIFREARYLLAEEVPAREPGLYHSVLGAIAGGNTTNGGIASYVGRSSAEIAHQLNVLEDCGLIARDLDVFRKGRSTYRICEPLLTFYQAVMRPRWSILELGEAERAWADARPAFLSQVAGPGFEQICRDWALRADGVFPGLQAEVGSGVVPDRATRAQIQIDVAVLASAEPGQPRRILSVGEAKWGKRLGLRHLHRLARARDLLGAQGYDTSETVLACYSGTGFDADLRSAAAATPGSVLLVDADRLYDS